MADDQKGPKKKSKLKWIILFLILLIIGGGGAGGWFMFGDKLFGKGGEETTPQPETRTVQQAQLPPAAGLIVPLDPFVVNLSDPLGRRYIKITFQVELTDQAAADVLGQLMPKVKDNLIMLLSSKAYADIASHESKILLKTEVVERLNHILGGSRVSQVYITDMVIQ